MSPKIVLSFPFEGGFYYFLNQHLSWAPEAAERTQGYYSVLFGAQAHLTKSRSTALAALFEEIVLVGADSYLPDRERSTKDGNYWHPDLRIRVPNSDFAEWDAGNMNLAEQLLASPAVQAALEVHYSSLLQHQRLQLLCRLLLQMRAAQTYDAVVVGDAHLCALHDVVLSVLAITDSQSAQLMGSEALTLESSSLPLVGLDFSCVDIDAFAAVRQSQEIRGYANQFREVISSATSAPDLTKQLLSLMKEAREQREIAGKIAGGFETTSSITSVAGLVPFVGPATGLVGLGADVAARTARYVQKNRDWYAIGAHMQRVALDDLLSRV